LKFYAALTLNGFHDQERDLTYLWKRIFKFRNSNFMPTVLSRLLSSS